jgi:hypothetical protein
LRDGLLDFSPNIELSVLVGTYINHKVASLINQGNYAVDNFLSIAPFSSNTAALDNRVDNKNKCDDMFVYQLKKDFNHSNPFTYLPYVTLRRNIRPFNNLDAITYVPIQTSVSTLTAQEETYGENITSMFSHFNLQHPNDFFDTSSGNGGVDHVVQYLSGL